MAQHNVDNILAVHQLATLTEKVEGRAWYPTAKTIAIELASRYGIPANQAVGVIAALSPRNKWERNVQDADALISAYVAGGADQAMVTKVCTFGKNKAKAVAILESGAETLPTVLEILSGPKLREFASCIAGLDDVTIDGHAFCIWQGERTRLEHVPAIGVKLRRQIKADYRQAADELGVTPSGVQAVSWLAWRRIHGVTK